jgi:ZIP family zinc transporter
MREYLPYLLFPGMLTGVGGILLLFWRRPSALGLHLGLALTGGVMIAASFFSLLLPAFSTGNKLVVLFAFLLGSLFMLFLDRLLPHHGASKEKSIKRRSRMILTALTIHNLPEGMAVGVAFAAGGMELGVPLAVAIALQNIPEGFAAGAVVRAGGGSGKRSALVSWMTGWVEPLAAILSYLLITQAGWLLEPALAFAAAAMIYVVIDELLPEAHTSAREDLVSLFFLFGFVIMMSLDILLA